MEKILSSIIENKFLFVSIIMFIIFIIFVIIYNFINNNDEEEDLNKQARLNEKRIREKNQLLTLISKTITPKIEGLSSKILVEDKTFTLQDLDEKLIGDISSIRNSYNRELHENHPNQFLLSSRLELTRGIFKNINEPTRYKEISNYKYKEVSNYIKQDLGSYLNSIYDDISNEISEVNKCTSYLYTQKLRHDKHVYIDTVLNKILKENSTHSMSTVSILNDSGVNVDYSVAINQYGIFFIRVIDNIPSHSIINIDSEGHWLVDEKEMNVFIQPNSIISKENLLSKLPEFKEIPIHCIYAIANNISIKSTDNTYKTKDGYYVMKLEAVDTVLNNSFNMLSTNSDLLESKTIERTAYSMLKYIGKNKLYLYKDITNNVNSSFKNINILKSRLDKINKIFEES